MSVAVDGVPLGFAYGDNSQWTTQTVAVHRPGYQRRRHPPKPPARHAPGRHHPHRSAGGTRLSAGGASLRPLRRRCLRRLDARNLGRPRWPRRRNTAQLIEWQLNFGLAPSNPPPVIYLSHGIPYTNTLARLRRPVLRRSSAAVGDHGHQHPRIRRPGPDVQPAARDRFLQPDQLPRAHRTSRSSVRWCPSGTNLLTTNGTPAARHRPALLPGRHQSQPGRRHLCPRGLVRHHHPHQLPDARLQRRRAGRHPALLPVRCSHQRRLARLPPRPSLSGSPAPSATSRSSSASTCRCRTSTTTTTSASSPAPTIKSSCWSPTPPPSPSRPTAGTSASSIPAPRNASFSVQACCATSYPVIIPLTNGIPFVVPATNSPFAAPPGPPQLFFFDFLITNADAGCPVRTLQLVRQRRPGPATRRAARPWRLISTPASSPAPTPEQIVLRTDLALPSSSTRARPARPLVSGRLQQRSG